MQNTLSECTTRRTLKQMGNSSRRPHRVPLLSAKNRIPIEHCLNATVYLSIVADHVHSFMTTVYPSSDGYFQQDNAACQKALITSDWFLEHDNEFTLLKWPPQSPDLNRALLGCGGTGDSHHRCAAKKICSNCVMLSCHYEPKSLRNVSNTLLNLCHEE